MSTPKAWEGGGLEQTPGVHRDPLAEVAGELVKTAESSSFRGCGGK